jgi:hypothetical protein
MRSYLRYYLPPSRVPPFHERPRRVTTRVPLALRSMLPPSCTSGRTVGTDLLYLPPSSCLLYELLYRALPACFGPLATSPFGRPCPGRSAGAFVLVSLAATVRRSSRAPDVRSPSPSIARACYLAGRTSYACGPLTIARSVHQAPFWRPCPRLPADRPMRATCYDRYVRALRTCLGPVHGPRRTCGCVWRTHLRAAAAAYMPHPPDCVWRPANVRRPRGYERCERCVRGHASVPPTTWRATGIVRRAS